MSYTLAYTGAEIDALLGKIDAIFVAEYGSTIYSEVTAAIAAGNKVIVANAGKVYVYAGQDDNSGYVFTQSGPNASKPNATYVTLSTGNVWSTATVDLATVQQFYASLMEDTASGSIASFPDGAENVPVKELTAEIEPIQDLHGLPYPYPNGGGADIFTGATWEQGAISANTGSTYAANKTASSTRIRIASLFSLTAGKTHTIDFDTTTYEVVMQPYDANGVQLVPASPFNQWLTAHQEFTATANLAIAIRRKDGANITPSEATAAAVKINLGTYANICPISGYTGAEITVNGNNLLNDTIRYYSSGNIFIGNTDTSFHTPSVTLPAGTYTIRVSASAVANIYANDTDTNTAIAGFPAYGVNVRTFTISKTTSIAFRIYSAAYTSLANFNWAVLVKGSTDPQDYIPYNGTVYSVSWSDEAGTVYGGHFTVNQDGSVDLTVERGRKLYTGASNEAWGLFGSGSASAFAMAISVSDMKQTNGRPAAEYLKTISEAETWGNYDGWVSNNGNLVVTGIKSITTVNAWKAYLNSHNLAVTYELATPQTYHLDSIGQITTLLGDNNIWSDTGDISVKYRANTALYIEKKLGE